MILEFIKVKRDIAEIAPTFVGSIGGVQVSNTTTYGILIILVVVLVVISLSGFRVAQGKITGYQLFVEWLYESAHGLIRQIAGSNAITKLIFPIVGSVFIYILLANLLGSIPGIGSITAHGQTLFRAATGDINTTLPLALCSVLLIHIYTIRYMGAKAFFDGIFHFSEIKASLGSGIKGVGSLILALFNVFLDLVGECAKILSMSLRLFGNMFAGDVLMTILLGIVSIGIPALWLGMSLLSALVQAVVFTSLISIFFSLSLAGLSDDSP